jgi:hypothetical protein
MRRESLYGSAKTSARSYRPNMTVSLSQPERLNPSGGGPRNLPLIQWILENDVTQGTKFTADTPKDVHPETLGRSATFRMDSEK